MIAPPRHSIPLNELDRGRRAHIAQLVGSADQVQRLKELGLQQGVNLEMVRPGSPCIVRLLGHTLCIRGNDLLNVLVCPGD